MKTRYLVAFFAIVISTSCFAQNKTLGVGAGTPNANAALHVESPTNNQGFIMPRLTTAQRTAMAGLPLTTADDGLMVYDKDIKKIYIWDGAAWQLAAGLNLPFASSTASPSPALNITNTGAGNAAFFQISNAANSSPALNAATDGTGPALALNVTNASNSFTALSIVHTGTGNAISANRPIQATQFIGDGSLLTNLPGGVSLPFAGSSGAASTAFEVTHTGFSNMAGDFQIQNPGSSSSALRAMTDGTGAAFTGVNTGTTGAAAYLQTTDLTNSQPAAIISSNGEGSAANFTITNASNSAPVISIVSAGPGPSIVAAGSIQASGFVGNGSGLTGITVVDVVIDPALNGFVSIGKGAGSSTQGVSIGNTVGGGGTSNVFIGNDLGNANSGDFNVFTGWHAGRLNTTGSGNTFLGAAVGIANTTGGTNTFLGWHAGQSNVTGASNVLIGAGAGNGVTGPGVPMTNGNNNILIGTHADIGTDGISNAIAIGNEAISENNGIAIGNGAVVSASNSVAIGDGALATTSNSIVLGNTTTSVGVGVTSPSAKFHVNHGSPSGFGSLFEITNVANSSPALISQTNGTGPAIQANQSNNGIAVDIVSGTMKHSTFTTAGLTITTRAGVYNLTGAGTYSLPTAGVVDGEVCLVYNSNAGSITVESVPMAAGIVHQFVRIGAAWRRVQ